MSTPQEKLRRAGIGCEIRTDDLTRRLYASDASIYEILPDAVAFPRSAEEAGAAVCAAGDAGLPVIPRGAGTGLSGGAVGRGLVIDFSRHHRAFEAFDRERRTIRVGAGVVLDALNAHVNPYGLWFGPDVATSSRATLGGMIANNSSGAHAPVYGTTAAYVRDLELVFADGRIEMVGPGFPTVPELRGAVDAILARYADAVRERFPNVLMKRWPGYALDRYLRDGPDLTAILAGSEGTLAAIASAELALVPLPKEKGLCLVFFDSIAEAAHATVELLDLEPAAVEMIDDVLWEQTRGQRAFQAARSLLRLDEQPSTCILIVEFFEGVADRLAALSRRNLGIRKAVFTDPREMEMIWNLRKAGLSLLTGCKGAAKPVPGIEDVAVAPHKLPEYVEGLLGLLEGMGLQSSFYGHAAAGLLHVRPVLDLHDPADLAKYRRLSDEVSALVLEVKGSISAEHGVGIGHTEYMPEHLGPELLEATRAIKALFDPKNVMNPGKIVPDPAYPYRIDHDLRPGVRALELPFAPVLAFAAKDESFLGNLEQCNGCGGCRKAAPTMCPTYLATGEEIMSTRGRANTIRAVLGRRLEEDPLHAEALEEALGNCLSCKACTTECPSNVNMALLKAELAHARIRCDGLTLRERFISSVDLLGRLGCTAPRLANVLLKTRWVRSAIERTLGLTAQRPLPPYALERFDCWFGKRPEPGRSRQAGRGRVILWDDTFVRYHEPQVGRAAVAVLDAAGYDVGIAHGRQCCGRPAFSVGRLDKARRLGEHNVRLLKSGQEPIVFLEPSCYSMFVEDYRELGVAETERVAERCVLFEHFVDALLEHEPEALMFAPGYTRVAIHAHCHAKALTDVRAMARLCERLPNPAVTLLDTGCCGMAGAFGALGAKYDLSLEVARPLIEQIDNLPAGVEVVASGTSCRHQIDHLTPLRPLHMAELLANALAKQDGESNPAKAVRKSNEDGSPPVS